jgi:uncharacterized protein YcfL
VIRNVMVRWLIAILLFLAGCNPVKQVLRSPEKTLVVVDKYLQKFPIHSDTTYIKVPGDSTVSTIFTSDTTVVHDTTNHTETVTVNHYYTTTVHAYDTLKIRYTDRSLEQSLQRSLTATSVALDQRTADLNDMRVSRNKFRLWFWLVVGMIIGSVVVWITIKLKT